MWNALTRFFVLVFVASILARLKTTLGLELEARATAEKALIEVQAKSQQLSVAKKAADEANQAKSQFLASMSHELRTPLNAIIGYSEMIQEELEDTGEKSLIPDLQKIHSAAKHQLGLINDILDLSKIEAGKMTLFVEEFDVFKLVSEVAATVRPLIAKNANALELDCPPNETTIALAGAKRSANAIGG